MFAIFYGSIIASCEALYMKNNVHEIADYKVALSLLIKERLPSFILGLFITSYISFSLLSKIGIKKEVAKVRETKQSQFSSVRTYTVQLNDDLWGIAQKMYGSGYNAEDIAVANKLSEPYTLTENQILIIPSIASKQPTQGEVTEKAATTKKVSEYVVLPGEYLWQIAEKVYGDGNQMSKLIERNNIPYPYNVEEGQKLMVP